MNALIIGCGRVGATIALQLNLEGWDVTVVDENEDALSRLGGQLARPVHRPGTGWTSTCCARPASRRPRLSSFATNGDNTNIVIGQVAQKRFGINCVVVRILDPARADFYAERGLRTVCPTKTAIDTLIEAVSGL